MNALFAPAVALLNRMRYPKKFALLGVIALLVIGSLLVQLAMTLRDDIDFAEKTLSEWKGSSSSSFLYFLQISSSRCLGVRSG